MSATSQGRVGGTADIDRGLARLAAEFSRLGLLGDCLATALLDSAGTGRHGEFVPATRDRIPRNVAGD